MNLFTLAAFTLIGAIAIDGDTLKLNGTSYRLWGIDAPERADPAATHALRRLIAGQPLECTELDKKAAPDHAVDGLFAWGG